MTKTVKSKLAELRTRLKKMIDAVLGGTHDHYLCYLPENTGFLSFFMLKLFFSGVKIDKEQTAVFQTIPKDAIIVYVTRYKSYFEYIFYHTRYKEEGLPSPEIGFSCKVFMLQPLSRIFKIFLANLDYFFKNRVFPDPYSSGYIKKELLGGRSALLSLIDDKGFRQRFIKSKTDPIRYLIETQATIDRPIYIIPQLMFFNKKPQRSIPSMIDILFGTEENPGKIRRLVTLFKNPGKVFVEISNPVSLKHFIENTKDNKQNIEHQSLVLRRYLLSQINRHRQAITGPTLKSKEELKESILTSDRLRSFMDRFAKTRKISKQKVFKEADGYLEEVAANYNMAVIRVLVTTVKWIVNIMFEGINVNSDALSRVKNMSQKGPLILMPCHKSHIDYLILSYLMFNNNMPCPHIAAGKNLSFWPMGPIFRRGGAFFLRRTLKGAVLYTKVFTEYIQKLLEEGFNIEFFIEGGRSRTGKLITPQLGLLSILLNAFKNGACDDMIFVPIFVGYDRVLEENSYLNEIEGGQKEAENFLQILKAGKFLKKRYGQIYVRFHEPLSLKELLSSYGSPIQEMTPKIQNAFCRDLGHRILNAIDSLSIVTPYALVASAVLNCSKESFSHDHLMSHIGTYMNYLSSQNVKLADTLLIDHVHAVNHVLDIYIQRKFIERISWNKFNELSDAQFRVNTNRRPLLEYYKNNSISFFIPAAFTALLILEKDAFQFSASNLHSGYKFLQEFFKNEFSYSVDRPPEYFVRKSLKSFIDDAIIIPHPTLPDTYNLTSAGFRKLNLFSSFLKTYFESYWIVINFFIRYPKNSISVKERLKKIQSLGNRMYRQKEIKRKESLSKVNYDNAVNFFITHGVRGSDDDEKIGFYADAIQRGLNRMSSS